MSFDTIGDLNWLAVIVAALAYFALGGLWYSPVLLGDAWMRATGVEDPGKGEGPGPAIYMFPLVGYLIAAIAMGMLAEATGSTSVGDGLVLGLVTGIGFAAVLFGVTAVFEANKPEPRTWFWISSAYHVLGFLIMAVVVAAWD